MAQIKTFSIPSGIRRVPGRFIHSLRGFRSFGSTDMGDRRARKAFKDLDIYQIKADLSWRRSHHRKSYRRVEGAVSDRAALTSLRYLKAGCDPQKSSRVNYREYGPKISKSKWISSPLLPSVRC